MINAFAFFGNIKVMFVSILQQLAVSTVTVLSENIMKIFFFKVLWIFHPWIISLKKNSHYSCSLDEVPTL